MISALSSEAAFEQWVKALVPRLDCTTIDVPSSILGCRVPQFGSGETRRQRPVVGRALFWYANERAEQVVIVIDQTEMADPETTSRQE